VKKGRVPGYALPIFSTLLGNAKAVCHDITNGEYICSGSIQMAFCIIFMTWL
jgi:hypothetical protein